MTASSATLWSGWNRSIRTEPEETESHSQAEGRMSLLAWLFFCLQILIEFKNFYRET